MWVGTADAGVMMINLGENFSQKSPEAAIRSRSKIFNTENGLKSNFVDVLYEDNSHGIWIGTLGGGATKIIPLAVRDRAEALSKAIVKTYSTKQGLNYFNVNAIFQDREINTEGIGLSFSTRPTDLQTTLCGQLFATARATCGWEQTTGLAK
jgi:ligand-binding sensor domain-containing protein